MKIALLSMAMAASQLTIPVSDSVPKLNVEATCRATVATDKAMNLVLAQSYEDCMRDENAAQQQLIPLWLSSSSQTRTQCEGEATSGGTDSYVDLLTCIQMTDSAKPPAPATDLRGASKTRNRK